MSKQGPTLEMEYRYGFSDPEEYVYRSRKGLDRQVVEEISAIKGEPDWMRKFRLKALQIFETKPMPGWGGDLSRLRFDDIYYYIRPTDRRGRSWDEVPETIKKTFDRLGIPEAERKFLAGVTAQYECLTGDTLVMGNPGPVPIRDIEPGTFVYALNEETRRLEKKRVLGVAVKGERPVFRVQVGGRTLKCTANHPFLQLTYTKEPGKKRGRFGTRWAYLSELKPGDYVAVVRKFPDAGEPFKLPSLPSLRIPEYTTDSFMWFAGLYLGDGYHRRYKAGSDGCFVEVALPDSEPAMRERLRGVLKEVFGYELGYGRDPFRVRVFPRLISQLLEAIGFRGNAHTKRLPKWVFHLPLSQRLALLGGYIDSDGTVRNSPRNSDVVLTSVNEELLKQVQLLAISCGLQAAGPYAFESRSSYKGVTTSRTAYRLLLSGDLSQLVPYSEKVAKGYRPRTYRHQFKSANGSPIASHVSEEIGFARIRSIEPAGTEMVYDIEVEGAHNFVAQGVVVHNSEVVYHSIRKELERQGVIFVDTDTAVREYPDLVREHFGTVVPPADNKFAALNSAVWSGGSFIWVPEGVKVEIPLQAYFRINARNMGQFERTLIIAEPGSFVHYVEGCTAPQYTTDSLHSAVVEIIVKRGARVRYTTIQNWSHNVYNLVTKRAAVYGDATMEWVDGNIGSRLTMKYPSVYLLEKGARGEVLSVAFAGPGQHQDAGAKAVHYAPYTTSVITNKSICKDGGRTTYRGLVHVADEAFKSKSKVNCDALIFDDRSRTDTIPYIEVLNSDVQMEHEATVSKVSEEQLFYLMSRGIPQEQATSMIVMGFIEPFTRQLPMEYAVELNRLIELEMEGSVG